MAFTFFWSINVCLPFLFTSITKGTLREASFPALFALLPPHLCHVTLRCLYLGVKSAGYGARFQHWSSNKHTGVNLGALVNFSGPGVPCSLVPLENTHFPFQEPGQDHPCPPSQAGCPSTGHIFPYGVCLSLLLPSVHPSVSAHRLQNQCHRVICL